MLTITEIAAEALGAHLAEHMGRRFGSTDAPLVDLLQSAARLAIDCIGNSDALYHNVEHTMLVTLAGLEILEGRHLLVETNASDFAHILAACLFHDIGYVKGVLEGDTIDSCVIDGNDNRAKLPRGASDAILLPYHVDRSKVFVLRRIGQTKLLDANRVAAAIEFTRVPVSPDGNDVNNEDGIIVRAACLIGQLGDPHFLRKANALYCEFKEVGITKQLGYASPADLIERYPQFDWSSVSEHVQKVSKYLNVTSAGRQWMSTLYSNVFRAERDIGLVAYGKTSGLI